MGKVGEDDIRAAAMMIECGCDRGWVAGYIGLTRHHLNRRIRDLADSRRDGRADIRERK